MPMFFVEKMSMSIDPDQNATMVKIDKMYHGTVAIIKSAKSSAHELLQKNLHVQ